MLIFSWQRMTEELACCICYGEGNAEKPLALDPRPCNCSGSMVFHKDCLTLLMYNNSEKKCSTCRVVYHEAYLPPKEYMHGRELVREFRYDGCSILYTINNERKKHGIYYIKRGDVIIETFHYVDGLRNGPYIRNYHSGDEAERGWYRKGKRYGLWVKYEDGGARIVSKCSYVKGRLHGHFLKYYSNDNVLSDEVYAEGYKHGWCNYYYNDKTLHMRRKYDYGSPIGKLELFRRDGRQTHELTYESGILTSFLELDEEGFVERHICTQGAKILYFAIPYGQLMMTPLVIGQECNEDMVMVGEE